MKKGSVFVIGALAVGGYLLMAQPQVVQAGGGGGAGKLLLIPQQLLGGGERPAEVTLNGEATKKELAPAPIINIYESEIPSPEQVFETKKETESKIPEIFRKKSASEIIGEMFKIPADRGVCIAPEFAPEPKKEKKEPVSKPSAWSLARGFAPALKSVTNWFGGLF